MSTTAIQLSDAGTHENRAATGRKRHPERRTNDTPAIAPCRSRLGYTHEGLLIYVPPAGRARFQPLDVLDRTVGTVLFIVSLLLIVPAAIATRMLSRRSPFIAHLRIGQDGQMFWVWKLRTMWPRRQPASSEETGWVQRIQCDPPPNIKPRSDARISSRFAQFCRRHSIDELPQFFHVMRGQMSLVGPRPLTRGELMQHYGTRANEILTLKPGLTGYWQTRGRSRLSYAERVALDLQLVRDLSTRVYLHLLLRTIPELVSGDNAW
jgi:exopolysaccharide production protein ExoY